MPVCDKFYISRCHETTSDFNVYIRDSGSGVTLNFKALCVCGMMMLFTYNRKYVLSSFTFAA
jgi:hypothetical protein